MKTLSALLMAFALVFTTYADPNDGLVQRTYHVTADKFLANLKHLLPAKPGETDAQLLIRFFKERGVEINPPERLFFSAKIGVLTRVTKSKQDKVLELINIISRGKDIPRSPVS